VRGTAVVYAKNLPRMRSFYEGVFEMTAVDEADDYCVLESESLTLSLVAIPDYIAAGIRLSDPPTRREAAPIKLAFTVDSIEHVRLVAATLGGAVDPSSTVWTFRDGVHCDGVDPEGNVIRLVQPITHTISATDH
jgi:predicted enzyme related to lactoylglutathione lyase